MKPKLIAIVGGSGTGKTWLAHKLLQTFGRKATSLSLDNFYRDRSRLSSKRRNRINFDHPRAVDWQEVERALGELAAGRAARVPEYDFATHGRIGKGKQVEPRPLVIVDGLWLLRRRALRQLFSSRIFLDCPLNLRLRRRMKRDVAQRGRVTAAVRQQFFEQVAPMHDRFVAPQSRWATIVLKNPGRRDFAKLTTQIKILLKQNHLCQTTK